jgi:hypothetical protein
VGLAPCFVESGRMPMPPMPPTQTWTHVSHERKPSSGLGPARTWAHASHGRNCKLRLCDSVLSRTRSRGLLLEGLAVHAARSPSVRMGTPCHWSTCVSPSTCTQTITDSYTLQ